MHLLILVDDHTNNSDVGRHKINISVISNFLLCKIYGMLSQEIFTKDVKNSLYKGMHFYLLRNGTM